MVDWQSLKITDHAIERFNERVTGSSKTDICRRIRQYWRDGRSFYVHGNMECKYYGPLVLVRRDHEIVTLYNRNTMSDFRPKELV